MKKILVVLALLVIGIPFPAYAASLDPYRGGWRGGGTLTPFKGSSEGIRCRATNTGSGSALAIALTCASASYKFTASGSLKSSGGSLSGNWNISDPPKSGSLSGTLSGNTITARLVSGAVTARIQVSVRGDVLAISLSFDSGSVQSIAVTLSKRK